MPARKVVTKTGSVLESTCSESRRPLPRQVLSSHMGLFCIWYWLIVTDVLFYEIYWNKMFCYQNLAAFCYQNLGVFSYQNLAVFCYQNFVVFCYQNFVVFCYQNIAVFWYRTTVFCNLNLRALCYPDLAVFCYTNRSILLLESFICYPILAVFCYLSDFSCCYEMRNTR